MTTYTQRFDIENQLTAVTVSQSSGSPQVTRFAYDGDGERFREDAPSGGVTLYVGELQELQVAAGQVVTRTSYYYHGGVRAGMRVAGVLYYLHADHLGSATLTTDEDGAVVARRDGDSSGPSALLATACCLRRPLRAHGNTTPATGDRTGPGGGRVRSSAA